MFDWAIGGLSSLFGWVGDGVASVAGWAWDKVIIGIYTWLANGLALLVEWVWSVLDAGTTPRVTQDWFRNELALRVGVIALAATVALMLASAMQAALVGRPEQIVDAVRQAVGSIVAAALTVTVLDVLIRVVDEAAAMVWQSGRSDLVSMIEAMVNTATVTGALGSTFVGPLCLLVGFFGLIGLVVSLMMRSALIYMAAALAPLVWATNVLPSFRGAARKLIHLTVALVVSKLAIVVTLTLAVKLIANPGRSNTESLINDGAAAVGQLMTGFIAFLIAAVTPAILYRLMPSVEGAVAGSGVAGGWGRSTAAIVSAGLMVKSLGASGAVSAATRPAAGQHGAAGAAGGAAGGQPPRGAIPGLTGAAARPASGAANPADGQTPSATAAPASRPRPSRGDRRVPTTASSRSRDDEQRDDE